MATEKQEWHELTKHGRKLARRAEDWDHRKSQMDNSDRDEAYDIARIKQNIKLRGDDMRELEEEAAHITSGLIKRLQRLARFQLRAKHG